MRKLIGIEAEVNITVSDDIIRKMSKGSPILNDILKEVKPDIIKAIKKCLSEEEKKHD